MTTNTPLPIERPTNPQALWDLVSANDAAPRHTLRHLGQALVSHGLVTQEQLQAALQTQQAQEQSGQRHLLGRLLVESGVLNEEQLRGVISAWLGQHTVDPALLPADSGALVLVPRATAEQAQVLPLMLRDDAVVVLMNDPWDKRVLDQLRFMTQRRVIPALAAPGTLMPAIQRAYRALQGNGQGGQRASARDLAVDLGSSSWCAWSTR